ncbi:hypothetical protein [Spongiimicrobium salis]|uniref:hypothetical protein n=1 Tax=Spongiimicrobium salis TaxID=1667022 RepID=UPI00374CC683
MTPFLDSIEAFLKRIFERIEQATAVSTEQLACFRVFFGLLMLVYFLPSWSWLNDVPPAFFNPRIFSFAYLTDGYLPDIIYLLCDILAIILLVCITLGIFTRKALLAMFVLSSILFSYALSFGKIDHYTNLFLIAYPALAFTNSGTRFALKKDKELSSATQARVLALLGIAIAFGFFTAGIPKLLYWVDFDLSSSGFLFWFYGVFLKDQHQYLLSPYVFKLPYYVFEAMDYLAAIFEVVGFFFLYKGRKFWRMYLTIACTFHFLNLLTLNYGFTLNSLCFGIFIVAPVLALLYRKYNSFLQQYANYFILTILGIALLKTVFLLWNNTGFRYHGYGPLLHLEHMVDLFLWSLTIFCGVYLLRSKSKSTH